MKKIYTTVGVFLAGLTVALAFMLATAEASDRVYVLAPKIRILSLDAQKTSLAYLASSICKHSYNFNDLINLDCRRSEAKPEASWSCQIDHYANTDLLTSKDLWEQLNDSNEKISGEGSIPIHHKSIQLSELDVITLKAFSDVIYDIPFISAAEMNCRSSLCAMKTYKIATLAQWRDDYELGKVDKIIGVVK